MLAICSTLGYIECNIQSCTSFSAMFACLCVAFSVCKAKSKTLILNVFTGRILASKRAGTPPPRPIQRQAAQRNGLAAVEDGEDDGILSGIEDEICGPLSPTVRSEFLLDFR